MCQKFDFRLGLHEEWFFGLDDFDGDFSLGLCIFGPYDLSKGSLSNAFLDFVSSIKQFSSSDNIIVIFVVPSIVVGALSLLFFLFSSGIPFLVIDSVDVFVSINETNG